MTETDSSFLSRSTAGCSSTTILYQQAATPMITHTHISCHLAGAAEHVLLLTTLADPCHQRTQGTTWHGCPSTPASASCCCWRPLQVNFLNLNKHKT